MTFRPRLDPWLSQPQCGRHEWPVPPPHRRIKILADAAISAPRAHAAQNQQDRWGLFAAISSSAAFSRVCPDHRITDGPFRTLAQHSRCCSRSPHFCHSLQPRKYVVGEFTQCGQTALSLRLRQSQLLNDFPDWYSLTRQTLCGPSGAELGKVQMEGVNRCTLG